MSTIKTLEKNSGSISLCGAQEAKHTEPSSMAPAQIDKQAMLDAANQAIMAIATGGQSYKIGSRSLQRGNLTEWKNMRAEIAAEIQAENNGGLLDNCYTAVFDRR